MKNENLLGTFSLFFAIVHLALIANITKKKKPKVIERLFHTFMRIKKYQFVIFVKVTIFQHKCCIFSDQNFP